MGREKALLLSSDQVFRFKCSRCLFCCTFYVLLYEQSLVTLHQFENTDDGDEISASIHIVGLYPRPNESWFEIHFYDPTITDFFRQQLRMTRTTFQMLLNVIAPRITRLDTRFRNCVPPKKVLALGLFRLAHGNSYISIAPAMNVENQH